MATGWHVYQSRVWSLHAGGICKLVDQTPKKLMNRLNFLRLWSLAVGGMDACTGLMLVFAPAPTLRLMQVPEVAPAALIFLSWMGVFIGSVGLSYALVLKGSREAETVWIFTAVVRLAVACFLVAEIFSGSLPSAWLLVAVTDGVVALGQGAVLRAGWWKGGEG